MLSGSKPGRAQAQPASAPPGRGVKLPPLSEASARRLDRLREASPLYSAELDRREGIGPWLEEDRNLREPFRFSALLETWAQHGPPPQDESDEARLGALRRWRRLMSMRIAHRSVNGIADEASTVEELTLLAEFCLRECLLLAQRRWAARLGEPWDRANGRPARFGVIALGKLGGRELNFSSDVDLLYLYEGDGWCRRGEVQTGASNEEYFTRVAETVTGWLGERTSDGFLFRADVRLRPEGAVGPLVRSLRALEYYYSTSGQTWERLAMIKARPVAGNIELGAELLESLHGFRYPRRPPPSLIEEVAAMKARGDDALAASGSLERNVKLGAGGIREIEFVAQSLQLLNAGRFPFLQTPSTDQALRLLSRYGILAPAESAALSEDYWFLRRVEHRLQIRDEEQTHTLPADPAGTARIAASMGFGSVGDFEAELGLRRGRTHAVYAALFADRGLDADLEAWWTFLTSEEIPPRIERRVRLWFGGDPGAADALRSFASGGRHRMVSRELAVRFQHVARAFDGFQAQLARPMGTLHRLSRFAERYGSRSQLLGFWSENPALFRVFAVLFDRSEAVCELLCAHPEIVEEVLRPQVLRRHADSRVLDTDIGAASRAGGFREWLWLYVRAEQLRYALGSLDAGLSVLETEQAMTALAEAVMRELVREQDLLVVALGKFGSRELSFGSDLDLMFICREGAELACAPRVDALRALVGRGGPLGPALEIDLRLRPHGPDGPLVSSIASLEAYHRGGGGKLWERQALVRARGVAGPADLAASFEAWRLELLYASGASRADLLEIRLMRARIERELGAGPRGWAFKAGSGGLTEITFLVQALQLRHGHALPAARSQGTRDALAQLAGGGRIGAPEAAELLANYEFLRRVETALRLDSNRPVVSLPRDEDGGAALARWLGFPGAEAFMREHLARMDRTRLICDKVASHLEFSMTP